MSEPGFLHENLKLETRRSVVSDIEFQASQVIERLEEAAERAAEKAVEGAANPVGGLAWKSTLPVLTLPSKTNAEIFRVLEDLITFEDSNNFSTWTEETSTQTDAENPTLASVPALDAASKLAAVSNGVAALACTLDRAHSQQLNARLASDCSRWIGNLFRLTEVTSESTLFFHEDPLEGIVRIGRYLLHKKYPKFQEDGFEALSERPVVYSSIASPLNIVQHLCRQLGLPLRCIQPVPCNTMFGSHQRMDVAELERLIEQDKNSHRVPLMVLADAGTVIAGHVDNLSRIHEVCAKHDIWMHLRGHNLAALVLTHPNAKPVKLADSLSLPLGNWLGIPSLPIVTMYYLPPVSESETEEASRNIALPVIAGLVNDLSTRRFVSLPLWTTLQALGREGIQTRITRAFESSEMMWKALSNLPSLRLVSQQPGGEAGSYGILDVVGKQLSPLLLVEVVASTVTFQFTNGSEKGRVSPYYDKLNTWLGHILQQECPQLVIDMCELDSHGIVLRYCPLELSPDYLPSREDIEQFTVCLEQQIEVLTATVQLKEVFQQSVSRSANLQLVQDMADWAGLGGVRYLPDNWELLPNANDELNRLNTQLVERLQNTDQAFSLGEDNEGMSYVRFGMVTAGSDVEELLEMVLSVGKEVEESSRFLETMSQVVKKGIEAATLDLQKENEERLWQEGLLRQVPVVGSLVNWWSPRNKEGGIKGRSLNLNAGVVESTENIYRYHMQLQGGGGSAGSQGARVTPTPMVQTPVGTVSGSQHSRSSSQASQVSQSSQILPQPQVQPSVQPQVQSQMLPQVQSEVQTQVQLQPQPLPQPESESQPQPLPQPQLQLQTAPTSDSSLQTLSSTVAEKDAKEPVL